jgi:hypothetical protein
VNKPEQALTDLIDSIIIIHAIFLVGEGKITTEEFGCLLGKPKVAGISGALLEKSITVRTQGLKPPSKEEQ